PRPRPDRRAGNPAGTGIRPRHPGSAGAPAPTLAPPPAGSLRPAGLAAALNHASRNACSTAAGAAKLAALPGGTHVLVVPAVRHRRLFLRPDHYPRRPAVAGVGDVAGLPAAVGPRPLPRPHRRRFHRHAARPAPGGTAGDP